MGVALAAHAQLTIPGANGSDGALVITENTVIDLAQAVAGNGTSIKWDTDNAANAGKGIYDPLKWAIVFKYSSVNIAAGKTLSFTNHPSRAPVVWLVNGNVTIAGTVDLNGATGGLAPAIAEPGPGGFRGGMGHFAPGVGVSSGFGPGGAGFEGGQGWGGSYGTQGGNGPVPYGNPSLVPLLGGSGGGGDGNEASGGGGGGGAILIATSQTLDVTGALRSNGGARQQSAHAGGGSGGGIRCVANSTTGTGNVSAVGGLGWSFHGGVGRIRLERVANTSTYAVTPDPSVVTLAPGSTALLWPPTEAPTVKVVSIGGQTAPADPRAGFGSTGPDVALPETTTTQVVVETTNVEQASQVQVRVGKRTNGAATTTNATVDTVVSTTPLVIRWVANVPVGVGYSAVQVKVVRP